MSQHELAGVMADFTTAHDDLVREHFLQGVSALVPSESLETTLPQTVRPVLDDAAYHGLAGDVVRLIQPHTEADPVGLLASFLAEVGTTLNRGPHLILDTFHPLLFWPVLVGRSSKSWKGTAAKRIEHLLQLADMSWTRGEIQGDLIERGRLGFCCAGSAI